MGRRTRSDFPGRNGFLLRAAGHTDFPGMNRACWRGWSPPWQSRPAGQSGISSTGFLVLLVIVGAGAFAYIQLSRPRETAPAAEAPPVALTEEDARREAL